MTPPVTTSLQPGNLKFLDGLRGDEPEEMPASKIQKITQYVYQTALQRVNNFRHRSMQRGVGQASVRSTSAPDSDGEDDRPTCSLNGVLIPDDDAPVFPPEVPELVNSLTCADLGFDARRVFQSTSRFQGISRTLRRSLPCYYIEVLEIPGHCNLSIFCLRRGGHEIPLHDHPGMFGMLKVIYGKIRIQSYSPMGNAMRQSMSSSRLVDGASFRSHHAGGFGEPFDDYRMHIRQDQDVILTAEDPASELRPQLRNLHRIEAVDGPAAFFDILVPPYHPPERDCRYYLLENEVSANGTSATVLDSKDQKNANTLLTAHTVPAPDTFYCENFPYMGPQIDRSFVGHLNNS